MPARTETYLNHTATGTRNQVRALRLTVREFVFGIPEPERGVREGRWVYLFKRGLKGTEVCAELQSLGTDGFTRVPWGSDTEWGQTPRDRREPASDAKKIITVRLEEEAELYACLSRIQLPYERIQELCSDEAKLKARCKRFDAETAPHLEVTDTGHVSVVYLMDYLDAVERLHRGSGDTSSAPQLFYSNVGVEGIAASSLADLCDDHQRYRERVDEIKERRGPSESQQGGSGPARSGVPGDSPSYLSALQRQLDYSQDEEKSKRLRLAYLAQSVAEEYRRQTGAGKEVWTSNVSYEKEDLPYNEQALQSEISAFERLQDDVESFAAFKYGLMRRAGYIATRDDYMFDVDYKASPGNDGSKSLKAQCFEDEARVLDHSFLSEAGRIYLGEQIRSEDSWYRRNFIDGDPGSIFGSDDGTETNLYFATILMNLGVVLPNARGAKDAKEICQSILDSWYRLSHKHESEKNGTRKVRLDPKRYAKEIGLDKLKNLELDKESALQTDRIERDVEVGELKLLASPADDLQLLGRSRVPVLATLYLVNSALTVSSLGEKPQSDVSVVMETFSLSGDLVETVGLFARTAATRGALVIAGAVLNIVAGAVGLTHALSRENWAEAFGWGIVLFGGFAGLFVAKFAWLAGPVGFLISVGAIIIHGATQEEDPYQKWFRTCEWGVERDKSKSIDEQTHDLLKPVARPKMSARWVGEIPDAKVELMAEPPFWIEGQTEVKVEEFNLHGVVPGEINVRKLHSDGYNLTKRTSQESSDQTDRPAAKVRIQVDWDSITQLAVPSSPSADMERAANTDLYHYVKGTWWMLHQVHTQIKYFSDTELWLEYTFDQINLDSSASS